MDDEKIIPLEKAAELEHEPEVEVEKTAAQMLRAFEDEHLGKNVPRISGHIEKGHGAKFHGMDDKRKAHHGALVKLVEAEEKLAEAAAAHSKAKAMHAEAAEAVNRHADAAE